MTEGLSRDWLVASCILFNGIAQKEFSETLAMLPAFVVWCWHTWLSFPKMRMCRYMLMAVLPVAC